jgi:hypothetical protein
VTVERIVATLKANTELAREVIGRTLGRLPKKRRCACQHALQYAMLTDLAAVPEPTRDALRPLIGKYLPAAKR